MRVRFHREAEVELVAEAEYDDSRSPGPGDRLTTEVEAAVRLASAFPEIGSPYRYGTRRVFTRKFPFSIVYRVVASELVVLAIVSFPRKPGYWRGRKSDD